MNGLRKVWRESASLLLLSKSPAKSPATCNYDVLVMKRSTASKFMANAIVFPGGVIEKSDSAGNWLDLYRNLGVDDKHLAALKNSRNKDFIYCRGEEEIDRELSLRITAVRETFEEVGVLLAKSAQDLKKDSSGLYSAALSESDFDHRFWQKEVQGNPTRFFDLCESLKVLPDVFSMHAWSNWLTPTSVGKHRFDTIFFVACLPERPELSMDEKEAQHVLWASPRDLIASHEAETIWLPPPQQYELGKLNQVQDFEEIAKFSHWRSQFGTTLFFPVQYPTQDSLIHVLPGDDLYPKEPNYTEKSADFEEYKDKNSNELMGNCKNLHRTVHQSMFQSELVMNIVPQNEHLCPQGESKVKAKL